MKNYNVSGIIEDQISKLIDTIPEIDKSIVISNINFMKIDSWKLWWTRWVIASYWFNKDTTNIVIKNLYDKIIKFNNFSKEDLENKIKTYKELGENLFESTDHLMNMSKIHNLKEVKSIGKYWDENTYGVKIININLTYEHLGYLFDIFKKSEEQHIRSYTEKNSKGATASTGRIILKNNDINNYKIFKKYPNNYYWIDLETDESVEESQALGHCGSGEYLYSLRELKKDEITNRLYFNVFLTLDFSNHDASLVQAKGKCNVPQPKYKEYMQDFIINFPSLKHTKLDYLESISIVENLEDLDYLMGHIKKFDFSNLFVNLIIKLEKENQLSNDITDKLYNTKYGDKFFKEFVEEEEND